MNFVSKNNFTDRKRLIEFDSTLKRNFIGLGIDGYIGLSIYLAAIEMDTDV